MERKVVLMQQAHVVLIFQSSAGIASSAALLEMLPKG
jgi:hypothetical protein